MVCGKARTGIRQSGARFAEQPRGRIRLRQHPASLLVPGGKNYPHPQRMAGKGNAAP